MQSQEWFTSFIEHLTRLSVLELSLVGINITLLFLAKPLFRLLARGKQIREDELMESRGFLLFQRANWILMLCVALYAFVMPLNDYFWFTKVISALMIISVANLVDAVLDVIILQRYGKLKKVEGEERFVETYRSRLISLVTTALIGVVSILFIIKMIGFESLLETGGVIGFIGVLLALSQGAWAPDLISGLILLNTQLFEEGDVIEISASRNVIGIVFKTKLFHTDLLDLATNHRVMIPNQQFRQNPLLNLSKFASAKGLRERLTFKIGYDVRQSDVQKLFTTVFERAKVDTSIPLNDIHGFELRVLDTGDFAIEWGFFYYLKEVKQLLATRHYLLALVAKTAEEMKISLATPILYQAVNSDTYLFPPEVVKTPLPETT